VSGLIPRRVEQWFKALVAAGIGGFANSILAALGVTAANGLGDHMPKLTFHQEIAIGAAGAFVSVLMFLKQSPVPPDSGNTQTFIKAGSPQPKPPGPPS